MLAGFEPRAGKSFGSRPTSLADEAEGAAVRFEMEFRCGGRDELACGGCCEGGCGWRGVCGRGVWGLSWTGG